MLITQRVFAVAFLLLGIALLAETVIVAGGTFAVGYVIGAIFIALGVLRLRATR